jgi:hypothetical protein
LPQAPAAVESADAGSADAESDQADSFVAPPVEDDVSQRARATTSGDELNSGEFSRSQDSSPYADSDAAPTDLGFVAGALLPTAAVVEMALLRQRWNESRVPAAAGSRRSGVLTHAARLYRRLRRSSEQTSTADFD